MHVSIKIKLISKQKLRSLIETSLIISVNRFSNIVVRNDSRELLNQTPWY